MHYFENQFFEVWNFFQASLHGGYSRNGGNFLICGLTQTKKIQNLAFKALFWKSERSKSPSTLVFDSLEIFFDLMAQSACPTNMKIHIFYAFLMIFAKKAVCIQEGFLNPGVNQRGLRQYQIFFFFEFFVKNLSNALFPVCFRQLFAEMRNFEHFQKLQKIHILKKTLNFLLHKSQFFEIFKFFENFKRSVLHWFLS